MPHIHEKIDITATAYLVHDNKVLLRMHDKYKKWLGVGGHVELDEDPNQAVVREVKEEVGLDVKLDFVPEYNDGQFKDLLAPDAMNIHYIPTLEDHRHMDMVYFIRSDSDNVVPGEGDRSDEWKWFTSEELDDPKYGLNPRVVRDAKKALKKF